MLVSGPPQQLEIPNNSSANVTEARATAKKRKKKDLSAGLNTVASIIAHTRKPELQMKPVCREKPIKPLVTKHNQVSHGAVLSAHPECIRAALGSAFMYGHKSHISLSHSAGRRHRQFSLKSRLNRMQ